MDTRPTKIPICGESFKIKYVAGLKDDDGDPALGLTDGEQRIISLCTIKNKSDSQMFRSLFHEYIHALFHITGHNAWLEDNMEEALVSMLEHNLFALVDTGKFTSR